ncbi:unnamed protein product [Fraxinus pennsylvanica]|uniref:Uncharacterized protein n=1 Tax=Fraxinus pennsylvanica TaxID=56036 RepID=A0AAD2AKB6_9LAMI|nr:unnamed protein product [Fraxinus pennsylvanica]
MLLNLKWSRHSGLSGYSSESSQGWKQTPPRTPTTLRRLGLKGHWEYIQSCILLESFSPCKPKFALASEGVSAGDRGHRRSHLSDASSFCKNRSRKLCHFGRFNPNH